MKILISLLVFLPILFSSSVTPDGEIKENDVLIGYNQKSYYSIKTIDYPTGSYYKTIDSSFVIERDLKTGIEKQKTFLKSTIHEDKNAMDEWETTEFKNSKFSFNKFLKNNNIKYLYPEIYKYTHKSIKFNIDLEGLKTISQAKTIVIESIENVKKFVPWIKESLITEKKLKKNFPKERVDYVKVLDFVMDDKFIFITIASEIDKKQQSILVLKTDKFKKLLKE